MKKLISVILVLLLLPSFSAFAFNLDVATMSDADLQSVIDQASQELQNRKMTQDGNTVVADSPELKAYITGRYKINQLNADEIDLVLETVYMSKCDFDVKIIPRNVCVDGWDCETNMFGNMVDLPANRMKKKDIVFRLSDAGLSSIEEIRNTEFAFDIYRPENLLTPFASTEPITYSR